VNELCNLRCPYCFASEFVNHDPKEMSMEVFKEALEFMLGDDSEVQVGIIGGEPTLYSHINEALELAMNDVRAYPVAVFTNAVNLEKIKPELLENRKYRMLINVNSPEDMGRVQYDKMRANIRRFIEEHIGEGRFKLSINLYKPDFDFSYVIDLVKEFQVNSVRVSISVPSRESLGEDDALSHFRKMKPVVLNFTRELVKWGVIPGFDCNFMPLCILTEEEQKELFGIKEFFKRHMDFDDSFWERSIVSEVQTCSPVVDILPDLTAVRCFGLSEYTKQNIRDFSGMSELMEYYVNNIDRCSRDYYSSPECKDCFKRRNRKCSAGCYTYKMDQILG
ncbi:MAG: radical SAM protein, partial [Clostridiales bacterium]|nr:radical SAM protein [Clostridiales bacterium]